MTIHKEGFTSIALTILFIAILNAVIHFYWPDNVALRWFAYILSFLLFVIILQFFRSPKRKLNVSETHVLCPADGKVVVIEEADETEYFKDKRIQISVFMSPVNVHVNRNPISGVVKYFKYHPGKYLVAWHPKSSTENERTTVVTENSAGIPVLFRQIAGALARRIVWYVKEGDKVKQGEQFGFIKFGSRVDIFVPLGTEIKVAIGEVVKGGQTVLAEFGAGIKKAKVETAEATDQPLVVATDVPTKPVKATVNETSVSEITEVEKPAKTEVDVKPVKAEPAKKEDKPEKAPAKEAKAAPSPAKPAAKKPTGKK
jgi:phosphatidylserine decarboxylase